MDAFDIDHWASGRRCYAYTALDDCSDRSACSSMPSIMNQLSICPRTLLSVIRPTVV